ncbi:DUF342 domain-containing protein [Caproiciproducens sp. NJN-50]|uniref:DUF342 domain-containing protein n=2 Tax=Acutalibacteraceae TaxID=3082771 RepID=UPI000FFE0E28|nr:FapA family protein [Caproiciproducens sp. NJN-50]QAT50671.1 DUF342 domain-containing protein [Caproiciproducens sp. NJN-50]
MAESDQKEELKKPEIQLSVSSDRLEATIRVKTAFHGQSVSFEEIVAFLKENGIVYGVLESVIRDYCENKKYFLDLVCARGLSPVDEKDGKLEYLFQREQNFMPEEREDGTVDYRNLGIVQNVKKGDVLCRILPPEPGENGIDVYNNPVEYRRGKIPSFPQGKNTAVSEDGLTLTADSDGCIEYKNANLSISEVFVVRGDVDSSSGNIDFLGTVIVQGDVLEGFSIKAGMDINVRGMVEGAMLEAGGNIAISCGMNGMSRGKLIAKGSVSAQYIENATVECAGDLRADVIFNSMVKAGNSIMARGRKGLLAGGRYQAGRSITANTIGSGGARTEVLIVSGVLDGLLTGREEESLDSVKAELSEEEKNLQTLCSQAETIALFLQKDPLSLKAKKLLKSANSQKELAESRIDYLKTKISAMGTADQSGLAILDFKVAALRIAYAGTRMTIGSFTETLSSDYSATKFYADHEHIVSSPIQPVDRT